MAAARRTGLSAVTAAATLAAIVVVLLLLPADVSAGPVANQAKEDARGGGIQARAEAASAHRRLSRNRRNISWYKQHSDFWNWYKYFTDNGNQEAVQELDRIYLAYLQNKNRAEGRRSYKAYLNHLGEVYKSCSESDDPNCVASYISRPKPEPPKPAPLKTCDPTKEASCLYAALMAGKSPYLPLVLPASVPSPAKSPAPLFVRSAAPAKDPQPPHYYYAPSSVSFLSKEQKAELVRICGADDVECLQYHLRAAYGYPPAAGAPPAHAHQGCDPQVDPTCKPSKKAPYGHYPQYPSCDPLRDPYCASAASPLKRFQEQKAELLRICGADDVECQQYHLRAAYGYPPAAGSPPAHAHQDCDPQADPTCKPSKKAPYGHYPQYPSCDPLRDPNCAFAASPLAPRAHNLPSPAGPGSCNPLFDDGCNPLTASKYATPPKAYKQEASEEAAAIRAPPPAADHYSNPYGMYRDANVHANRVGDPYSTYHQASAPVEPPANDPYAMMRRFMAQVQGSDPYAPRTEVTPETDPNDPFSAMRDSAAMHRHGARQQYLFSHPEEPTREERHPLGPPGKTREGYDCYVGYDRECFPLQPTEPRSGVHRRVPYPAESYEPHLNADGTRRGVLEPANPHCDPEFDRDCRLRRLEPEQPRHEVQPERRQTQPEASEQDPNEAEPYQSGQEEPYVSNMPTPPQGMPSLQDILRSYGDRFPEHDDYRKK
ncbi:actinodin1 [Syngnathus acus]|uniref:actinodin1 n=1 Tax=Syngnathus acus TaxID=161584 RepID=UPI0018864476|nr:actinodin1 [Syngnathus acus]